MGKATFTPTQDEYRFYEDGAVASSTALGTQSTSFDRTISSDNLIQLRIQIQETGGADGVSTDDYQLQVQLGAGGYNNVTSSSTYVRTGLGTPTDSSAVSASRLTGGSGSFVAGKYDEGDGINSDVQITASNYTELVWSLTLDYSDLSDNDSLTFRVLINGATMTYNVTPTLTIDKPPTYSQAAYRFYEDGTETGSTAIDAQNTNITRDVSSGDSNLQLRVRLQNSNAVAGLSTDDYQLQYELNDSGTYLNVNTPTIVDSYSESNNSLDVGLGTGNKKLGQSFTGNGGTLSKATFYLKNDASVTGNATVSIFAHSGAFGTSSVGSGAALATSGTVDVSTIASSYALIDFTFTGGNQITLTNGTKYVVAIELSSVAALKVGTDNSSPSHGGNFSFADGTPTWDFDASIDVIFYVYSNAGTEVIGYNSASLTDGNATTNRLGSGTGSFVAGEISEDGLVDNLAITASNYTELLYSLTIESTAVADNDTLDFRVLRNGATTGMTYTVTPRITIEESSGATLVTQDISHTLNLDTTTITQNHVLTAQDISHTLNLDNTTISQNHVIAPQDISHGLTLDNTTLDVTHIISVNDIQHGLTLDTTTITQNHAITPDDIAFSLAEDNGTISQNHIIATQDVQLGLTVDTTTINQTHIIASNDVQLGLTEDNTTISQNHIVASIDTQLGLTLDNATINQNHILAPQDIEHGITLDNTTVEVGAITIVTQDTELGLTLDNTTITQNHIITTDDIAFSITTDNTTVEETNFNLVVQDIAHGFTLDNTTITQNHVVAVQDVELGLTLDNTTITQTQVIASQDTQLGLTTDSTTINQNHVISTDDIAFSLTSDEGTISQNHIIVTQDIEHGLTLDSTTLDLAVQISPADIELGLTTDNTTISQNHIIASQDAELGLTLDNGTVTEANVTIITQDLELGTTIDATTIAQNHVLTPDDIAFQTTTDEGSISQNHIIVSNDISLGVLLDIATITQNHILVTQDTELGLTIDATTVVETNFSLSANDLSHALSLDNTTLEQSHVIGSQDTVLGLRIDNASLQSQITARNYYTDLNGNVYYVLNQSAGIVEKV